MQSYSVGSNACGCDEKLHSSRLIAVTGGPGAGKTAILELARRSFCEHVAILPEAAGIVFGGGFPRHDSEPGRRGAQLAIYHVQRSIELVVIGERQVGIALCDRGTLDGLAYWPGTEESYFEQTGTSQATEYERYAAVIHLRSPSAEHGYNRENKLRIESAAEASAIDERIAQAWAKHPRVVTIECVEDFFAKARVALETVRSELPKCCLSHALP
ncbi:MAG: ATP-binding protein [Fimbriimonadaceae bacterium]